MDKSKTLLAYVKEINLKMKQNQMSQGNDIVSFNKKVAGLEK